MSEALSGYQDTTLSDSGYPAIRLIVTAPENLMSWCSVTGEMMGVILSAAKNLSNESLISFRKPDASPSAQHDHPSNHM